MGVPSPLRVARAAGRLQARPLAKRIRVAGCPMPETINFDHYQVLTRDDGSLYELGRGAMGITFKAFDTNLRVPVALKVINATYLDSELARQRFIREARSAAKLRHRHVASVFHLGINGDAYFYAMEFIDGETVDALIKRQGPLPPVLALRITAQVARALSAAQAHGLVHRDIKPSNLMLVREDEELAVKVIDFGLAKSSAPGEHDHEAGGGFVGTPHFASPEQLQEKEIDVCSDIYSLGVTLWFMLRGDTPFNGSFQEVMEQHLSVAPPFERVEHVPTPIIGLLERMLQKDAADRPQTAADLRKLTEECLEEVAGSASTGAAAGSANEHFAGLLNGSSDAAGQFQLGSLVAERYRLVAALGETNAGRLFRAEEISGGREMRLLVLNRDLIENQAACTQIEREVEKAAAVQHPNLLQIHALETVAEGMFIVMEWTNGFSLLEVLRVRRELHAGEVLLLLPQIADGIDHAVKAGLKRLDLALHQIFFHFEGERVSRETLLPRELDQWPPFAVKLNPLGITRELSLSETWAGRQTIVGGSSGPAAETLDSRILYLQSLGAIVYELLGGTLAPFGFGTAGSPRYTPLATLSEEGNNILRRALNPAESFPSAYDFFRTLGQVEELEIKRHDPKLGTIASKGSMAPMSAAPASAKRNSTVILGAAAAVAILITAGSFLLNRGGDDPQPQVAGSGASGTAPLETQTDSSEAASEESTEMPAPDPPAPPSPPDRRELLKAAIAEVEAIEAQEDWAKSLEGWVRVAREYPEFEIGKLRLEMLIERLRGRTAEVNAREFPDLRGLVADAAQLDVLSAMLFLADMLRKSEPVTAFNWYSAAAAQGDVGALTQVGLLLSNGVPEHDVAKALKCFEEASEKGHPPAKLALADCYLRGVGVTKDPKRAVELLEEAAAKSDPRAMDLLGTCYHRGVGVEQDFKKAAQLFSKAYDLGLVESLGNLGVLHINGDGVPPNPQKAVQLFQKGSQAGDGYCMYLYARCYELGSGVAPNRGQAEFWYKKAAEAGNALAAEWCRKNGIPPARR